MIEENTWLHLTFGTCELYFIIYELSKRRRLIITDNFLGFISLALNDVSINAAFLRNDLWRPKSNLKLNCCHSVLQLSSCNIWFSNLKCCDDEKNSNDNPSKNSGTWWDNFMAGRFQREWRKSTQPFKDLAELEEGSYWLK